MRKIIILLLLVTLASCARKPAQLVPITELVPLTPTTEIITELVPLTPTASN